jgi:murein DD-endopeptidase MepM/ murein hydrolase activator NlpD
MFIKVQRKNIVSDEIGLKFKGIMKTALKLVTSILLGLLLVGGIWLAARIPRGKSAALRPPPTSVLIQVNVAGAVVRPGAYNLEPNSRIADAVEAAGGFALEADENGLNLAARVENGQRLEIPYKTGFVPAEERDSGGILKKTLSSSAENELMDSDSTALDELKKTPEKVSTIATTSSATPSCSDGPVGSGAFVWPGDNHFLSGNDYGPEHPGIDIAAGEGSQVYAADSGIVTAKGYDESGYGNVIQIDHGNGYSTVYAHLSEIGVSMCQGVYAGQLIGAAGNTGNSHGAHLHFEVVRDGWSINPWLVLP